MKVEVRLAGRRKAWIIALASLAILGQAKAEVVAMPPANADLVGQPRYVTAHQEDTLIDIAREYSLGQDEIVMANPTVDRWLPKEGTQVLLPKQYILPDAPRSGIVINIPEMRMFYFPLVGKGPGAHAEQIITYPISIGRMDWRTPIGKTTVIQKIKDPSWRPPATIKAEHAKDGDFLPDVVPPGPNNPLGQFAMKLGVPGYLIHGTDVEKAYGIGMRVTHGCIRMYPEDVAKLYPQVSVGTPVYLVNQPVKLGYVGDDLYIEVSQPLDEDSMSTQQLMEMASRLIMARTTRHPVAINQASLKAAVEHPTGVPTLISLKDGQTNGAVSAGQQWVTEEQPAANQKSYAEPPAAPGYVPMDAPVPAEEIF